MSKDKERADNDSPWKEILEAYFPLAIEFFFPQTAALIDWSKPHWQLFSANSVTLLDTFEI